MKRIALLALSIATMFAAPALAIDLHEARAQGSVGEKSDGYIAVLKPGGGVDALVSEVNAKRSQEYSRISQSNGQSISVVATLAAAQIVKNLPAGSKYQSGDGSWQTK